MKNQNETKLDFSKLPQRSRDKFNEAWNSADSTNMGLLLDPMNKTLRFEWECRTGEKLPRTIGKTHEKVRNYFLTNPKPATY